MTGAWARLRARCAACILKQREDTCGRTGSGWFRRSRHSRRRSRTRLRWQNRWSSGSARRGPSAHSAGTHERQKPPLRGGGFCIHRRQCRQHCRLLREGWSQAPGAAQARNDSRRRDHLQNFAGHERSHGQGKDGCRRLMGEDREPRGSGEKNDAVAHGGSAEGRGKARRVSVAEAAEEAACEPCHRGVGEQIAGRGPEQMEQRRPHQPG